MSVYDDLGNMTNERAGELARETGQKVDKLFNDLFDEGMTFVEARALMGYLKSEISCTATLNLMQHQLQLKSGRGVSVKIYGEYPACLDEECPLKQDCANHTTAGDYRTKDGLTPDLVKTDAGWQCNRHAGGDAGWSRGRMGAILVSGAYIGEHDD